MAFASFFKHRSIHLCIVFSSEQYHADLCTMLSPKLDHVQRINSPPIHQAYLPIPNSQPHDNMCAPHLGTLPDDTLSRTRLPTALHHRTTQGARLHTHTAWLPWCTAWRLLGLLAGC